MLSERHIRGIEQRALSAETAAAMGLYSGKRLRDGSVVADPKGDILCFPFLEGDAEVNTKYRWSQDGEKRFMQRKGAVKTLFNANVLLDDDMLVELETGTFSLIWTEGEFDCMAGVECGYPHTVSLPDGAMPGRDAKGRLIEVPDHAKDIDPEDDDKFAFMGRLMDRIMRVKSHIIATDNDDSGRRMAKELVRRIGPARCYFVTYPDQAIVPDAKTKGRLRPCKDLNEVKQYLGDDAVREMIDTAKPWPVKGLFKLSDYPDQDMPVMYETGISPELDRLFRIYAGAFIVTTGQPNIGKSTLVNQMVVNMARIHKWPIAMFSGEKQVKPFLRNELMTCFLGKAREDWTHEDRLRATAFVERYFSFIDHDPRLDDQDIDLDYLLDRAATAVFREGVKLLLVDPWNELEHKRPATQSMTEYVGDAIRKLKRFGKSFDCAVWVVAHPTKMEKGQVPGLYSVSDCYSDDTEALTRRGWLPHSEITLEDEVLCFDPKNGYLDWHRPSRVVSQDYAGEMVSLRGYGYDLLVTPNHRMVVKPAWEDPVGSQVETGIGRPTKWTKGEWAFAPAGEIASGARFKMPKAGMPVPGANPDWLEVHGKIVPAEPFLELVGWWLAEGCFASSGVSLCQAVGEKADIIDRLIAQCGFEPTRAVRRDPRGFQDMVTWYFGSTNHPEFVRWIKEKTGPGGAANKRIPYPVFSLSNRLKVALLQGYIDGDGHRPQNREGFSAITTSKQLFDDLQRLAAECGIPVSGHERTPAKENHSTSYQINFGREARREVTLRGGRNVRTVAYEGKIWCLTVPTGAYVVRRNGNVVVCGNSAHWANKADLGLIVHADDPNEPLRDVIIPKVRLKGIAGMTGQTTLGFDPRAYLFTKAPF